MAQRQLRNSYSPPKKLTDPRSTFSGKKLTALIVVNALALVAGYLAWTKIPRTTSTEASSTNNARSFSYTYLTKTSDATGLNSAFAQDVNDCVIPTASLYGYNLYIVAGYRSIADQNALYDQGRTVDGHIVTQAQGGQSMHNFGYAVDLGDHAYGENIDYSKLAQITSWCGLEHGDRGYTDLPHFEYRGDLSLEEFQIGMRPKPIQLPCAVLKTDADTNTPLTLDQLQSCGAPQFSQISPVDNTITSE